MRNWHTHINYSMTNSQRIRERDREREFFGTWSLQASTVAHDDEGVKSLGYGSRCQQGKGKSIHQLHVAQS